MGATLTRLVGEYLFNQKVGSELQLAREAASAGEDALFQRDGAALYDALRHFLSGQDAQRALALDLNGVVQADTLSELNGVQLRAPRGGRRALRAGVGLRLLSARRGRPAGRSLHHRQAERRHDQSLRRAHDSREGALIGVLVLVATSQDAYRALADVQVQMLSWLALVAVIVVVISVAMSRYFTRPIAELNEGIVEMTRGDFSNRVRVRGHNEFAQLAVAFNMMCERIENLDKARSQFVSNASHELKTPLSTMKILIETLMYQDPMDPDMTREFLGDINKEIDRLNSVIGDLLTLVSMDGGEKKLETKPVAVADILGDNVRRLQPLAREKGIEMTASLRDQTATVDGDASRLTQVFYNLMDNAIKYTGRGGSVRVEMSRRDKKVIVKVIDTGIGIPREDQLHIFDRFYRVDKARSRETGGTGLGLSIVRQIVLLHGGTVTVSSEEEKGSTFTVELPESGAKA